MVNMGIREKVERLVQRMHDSPQYPNQGAVVFVDLERRQTRRAYLPLEVLRTFLGGRGANMFLLYNLLEEGREALDPEIPLIFGAGVLPGSIPAGTRGNFTSISPDSYAIMDNNGGDYFPTYVKRHGYDHIVLYCKAREWTLLRIALDEISFHDATGYLGLNNMDTCHAVEKDFDCTERKDMALARIATSGENLVLCSGIMGGVKAIWARGGGGAKMGSLKLKGILIQGKPPEMKPVHDMKAANKAIGKQITSTSVIKNVLKKVGTQFLYKPTRLLGVLVTRNYQDTTWTEDLDADNFDPYRSGMDGCHKCPVHCRAGNDLTPEGKGGWGAGSLKGLKGNASYDHAQADLVHQHPKNYQGVRGDGVYDKYDRGDGPEGATMGKFGPNICIKDPEHLLRLNNLLNDLGLDSSGTGGAIGWAMELYQRGIITQEQTGGLDLTWGNMEAVEKLLQMTARREGFGDVIADCARAVERGKYPREALRYRVTVKGLFQSDHHDARVLKAFALGLSVATRGFDHLRNRVAMEINARINDDPAFKAALYGGKVAGEPNSYEGKEIAVRRVENTYAVGDSVGMCRMTTKFMNSPSLPGLDDFGEPLRCLTGQTFTAAELEETGRNVTGIERLINFRIGLRAADDTLPPRWFEEPIRVGPFKGEKVDRIEFEAMKARFYALTGLNSEGVPQLAWHEKLSRVATGFALRVEFHDRVPGAPEQAVIIDEPVSNVIELRQALKRKLPEAAEAIDDRHLNMAVNGDMVVASERNAEVHNGDRIALVPVLTGG